MRGRMRGPGGWLPRAAVLAVLLGACAGPRLELVAVPGRPGMELIAAEIELAVLPDAWRGDPHDLSRHYTPLGVRIANRRPTELRVRLGDFRLQGQRGTQFPAVPAAEVAWALFGGGLSPDLPRLAGAPPGLPGWYPWGPPPPGPPPGPPPSPTPTPPWGPAPARGRAYDLLASALREGRLLPGARTEGFLYFRLATREAERLTLTWTPTPDDGPPLAVFRLELAVVR